VQLKVGLRKNEEAFVKGLVVGGLVVGKDRIWRGGVKVLKRIV
jgi:hypothetical protein